jgi:anti-anti-sigma regulatory factor
VVWLRGEHDDSTISALSLTLARAIALEDDTVVIDLSEVQQLSLATIDVLIRARELRRLRSRALLFRSPSSSVARLLGEARVGHEQSATLIKAVGGPEGP